MHSKTGRVPESFSSVHHEIHSEIKYVDFDFKICWQSKEFSIILDNQNLKLLLMMRYELKSDHSSSSGHPLAKR